VHPLAASFFLQMAVILIACRLVGLVARKIGQPQVVGGMIAGVMVGPALLGLFWPEPATLVFTRGSRGVLEAGVSRLEEKTWLGRFERQKAIVPELEGNHSEGLPGELDPWIFAAGIPRN
jgi:hypothetical protein